MTQLQPHKDTYAIAVPLDACEYEIAYNHIFYFPYKEECNSEDIKLPPGQWQILGEVTKDAISWEVWNIVFKENEFGNSPKVLNERVYSLLAANGLYFVNPMGNKPKLLVRSVNEDAQHEREQINSDIKKQWQLYQDKLIEKVLIIQKVEQ